MDRKTTPIDAERRPWHWTTYFLGGLVLLACLLMNAGRDFNPEIRIYEHGWPWKFRETKMYYEWNEPKEPIQWPALFSNILCFTVIALLFMVTWQRRVRRLKHWWQFSLRDLILLCVVLTAVCAWFRVLYSDNRIEHQLNEVPHSWTKKDVPADWFWDVLHIPEKYRPYRIFTLFHEPASDHDLELISQLKYLRKLELEDSEHITPDGWKSLTKIKALETLDIGYFDCDYGPGSRPDPNQLSQIDTAALTQLTHLPSLHRLHIRSTLVQREWFEVLRRFPALTRVEIFSEITELGYGFNVQPGQGLSAADEELFCSKLLQKQ